MSINAVYEDSQGNVQEARMDGVDLTTKISIADDFSALVNYAVGDFCYHLGTLYKCTTAHTAGAWNAAHFTATQVGDELSELKNFLNISTADLIPNSDVVYLNYGLTVSKSGNTKIANLICVVNEITDTVNWTTLCDIPSGFLPTLKYEIQIFIGYTPISVQLNENSNHILIRPSGTITNATIIAQIAYF